MLGDSPVGVLKIRYVQLEAFLHSSRSRFSVSGFVHKASVIGHQALYQAQVFRRQPSVSECFISGILSGLVCRPRPSNVAFDLGVDAHEPVRQRPRLGNEIEDKTLERPHRSQNLINFALIDLPYQTSVPDSSSRDSRFKLVFFCPQSIQFGAVALINSGNENKAPGPQSKGSTKQGLVLLHPTKRNEVRPPTDQTIQPEDLPICSDVPFHNEGYEHERYRQPGVAEPILPSPHSDAPNCGNEAYEGDSVKEHA